MSTCQLPRPQVDVGQAGDVSEKRIGASACSSRGRDRARANGYRSSGGRWGQEYAHGSVCAMASSRALGSCCTSVFVIEWGRITVLQIYTIWHRGQRLILLLGLLASDNPPNQKWSSQPPEVQTLEADSRPLQDALRTAGIVLCDQGLVLGLAPQRNPAHVCCGRRHLLIVQHLRLLRALTCGHPLLKGVRLGLQVTLGP